MEFERCKMIDATVIFVDWAPTEHKRDIHGGGSIRRHYAWAALNKSVSEVVPFRKKDSSINWKAVIMMFKKDSVIWVEYGCGGVAHFFVLLSSVSFTRSKKIILNVHDFAIQQSRDFDKEMPFLKKIRLRVFEWLLLHRANVIIFAWPRFLDYFTPKRGQKILIMAPGVEEDELSVPSSNNIEKGKKVAVYFGSMRRKDAIPKVIELFSELKEWELHLIGLKEGEEIIEKENVKYLGTVSHDKLSDILSNADVVLIPLPKNVYLDKSIPIKLGYALKLCKPIIVTKLKGISEYVSMVALEENVIYIEEWNLDTLKDALQKAQSLNINAEKTIERLRTMAWEPRFKRAVRIALEMCPDRLEDAEIGSLQEI